MWFKWAAFFSKMDEITNVLNYNFTTSTLTVTRVNLFSNIPFSCLWISRKLGFIINNINNSITILMIVIFPSRWVFQKEDQARIQQGVKWHPCPPNYQTHPTAWLPVPSRPRRFGLTSCFKISEAKKEARKNRVWTSPRSSNPRFSETKAAVWRGSSIQTSSRSRLYTVMTIVGTNRSGEQTGDRMAHPDRNWIEIRAPKTLHGMEPVSYTFAKKTAPNLF